jgi:hypothetical protein
MVFGGIPKLPKFSPYSKNRNGIPFDLFGGMENHFP